MTVIDSVAVVGVSQLARYHIDSWAARRFRRLILLATSAGHSVSDNAEKTLELADRPCLLQKERPFHRFAERSDLVSPWRIAFVRQTAEKRKEIVKATCWVGQRE